MKKGLKVVATITLVCFLTTQSVWGAPAAGIEIAGGRELPAYLSIDIPAELGTVDALYEAPMSANPQFILHIQNAHANYQAQMKIKQLLGYMNKKYGFKTIFVEGASEKLDADYLRLFPDQDRNLKLCDELAKQGELTGTELFLMEQTTDQRPETTDQSKKDFSLQSQVSSLRSDGSAVEALGIEEASLYKANYEVLKKVFGAETDVTRFFKGFDGKLDKVASKTFTPETRELIADWKRFEQGRRDFMPFVKGLAAKSKKILKVDLESLFAQVGWPQISRLLVIQQMEKDMNKTKGVEEQAVLIKMLRTKGVSKELLATLENFSEGSISVGKSATEVSPREVLERLAVEAGPKGFKFSDYPAFSLYAGYVTLRSELDPKVLFEEIEYLFTQMLDTLAKEPQQKALLALYRDGELLRKLLHLELNRAQWRQLLEQKDRVAIPSLVSRLKECVQGLGTRDSGLDQKRGTKTNPEELATSPATSATALGDVMPPKFAAKMDELFTAGLEFYDYAHKREAVFYKEIQAAMTERKITKAILITGGFHTDGMSDLFRENAMSYGIVTPRLSEKSDENLYQKVMLQSREYPFSVSYLEMVSRMLKINVMIDMGVDVAKLYTGLIDLMLHRNNESIPETVAQFNASPLAINNKIILSFVSRDAKNRPTYKIVPRAKVESIPLDQPLPVAGVSDITIAETLKVQTGLLTPEALQRIREFGGDGTARGTDLAALSVVPVTPTVVVPALPAGRRAEARDVAKIVVDQLVALAENPKLFHDGPRMDLIDQGKKVREVLEGLTELQLKALLNLWKDKVTDPLFSSSVSPTDTKLVKKILRFSSVEAAISEQIKTARSEARLAESDVRQIQDGVLRSLAQFEEFTQSSTSSNVINDRHQIFAKNQFVVRDFSGIENIRPGDVVLTHHMDPQGVPIDALALIMRSNTDGLGGFSQITLGKDGIETIEVRLSDFLSGFMKPEFVYRPTFIRSEAREVDDARFIKELGQTDSLMALFGDFRVYEDVVANFRGLVKEKGGDFQAAVDETKRRIRVELIPEIERQIQEGQQQTRKEKADLARNTIIGGVAGLAIGVLAIGTIVGFSLLGSVLILTLAIIGASIPAASWLLNEDAHRISEELRVDRSEKNIVSSTLKWLDRVYPARSEARETKTAMPEIEVGPARRATEVLSAPTLSDVLGKSVYEIDGVGSALLWLAENKVTPENFRSVNGAQGQLKRLAQEMVRLELSRNARERFINYLYGTTQAWIGDWLSRAVVTGPAVKKSGVIVPSSSIPVLGVQAPRPGILLDVYGREIKPPGHSEIFLKRAWFWASSIAGTFATAPLALIDTLRRDINTFRERESFLKKRVFWLAAAAVLALALFLRSPETGEFWRDVFSMEKPQPVAVIRHTNMSKMLIKTNELAAITGFGSHQPYVVSPGPLGVMPLTGTGTVARIKPPLFGDKTGFTWPMDYSDGNTADGNLSHRGLFVTKPVFGYTPVFDPLDTETVTVKLDPASYPNGFYLALPKDPGSTVTQFSLDGFGFAESGAVINGVKVASNGVVTGTPANGQPVEVTYKFAMWSDPDAWTLDESYWWRSTADETRMRNEVLDIPAPIRTQLDGLKGLPLQDQIEGVHDIVRSYLVYYFDHRMVRLAPNETLSQYLGRAMARGEKLGVNCDELTELGMDMFRYLGYQEAGGGIVAGRGYGHQQNGTTFENEGPESDLHASFWVRDPLSRKMQNVELTAGLKVITQDQGWKVREMRPFKAEQVLENPNLTDSHNIGFSEYAGVLLGQDTNMTQKAAGFLNKNFTKELPDPAKGYRPSTDRDLPERILLAVAARVPLPEWSQPLKDFIRTLKPDSVSRLYRQSMEPGGDVAMRSLIWSLWTNQRDLSPNLIEFWYTTPDFELMLTIHQTTPLPPELLARWQKDYGDNAPSLFKDLTAKDPQARTGAAARFALLPGMFDQLSGSESVDAFGRIVEMLGAGKGLGPLTKEFDKVPAQADPAKEYQRKYLRSLTGLDGGLTTAEVLENLPSAEGAEGVNLAGMLNSASPTNIVSSLQGLKGNTNYAGIAKTFVDLFDMPSVLESRTNNVFALTQIGNELPAEVRPDFYEKDPLLSGVGTVMGEKNPKLDQAIRDCIAGALENVLGADLLEKLKSGELKDALFFLPKDTKEALGKINADPRVKSAILKMTGSRKDAVRPADLPRLREILTAAPRSEARVEQNFEMRVGYTTPFTMISIDPRLGLRVVNDNGTWQMQIRDDNAPDYFDRFRFQFDTPLTRALPGIKDLVTFTVHQIDSDHARVTMGRSEARRSLLEDEILRPGAVLVSSLLGIGTMMKVAMFESARASADLTAAALFFTTTTLGIIAGTFVGAGLYYLVLSPIVRLIGKWDVSRPNRRAFFAGPDVLTLDRNLPEMKRAIREDLTILDLDLQSGRELNRWTISGIQDAIDALKAAEDRLEKAGLMPASQREAPALTRNFEAFLNRSEARGGAKAWSDEIAMRVLADIQVARFDPILESYLRENLASKLAVHYEQGRQWENAALANAIVGALGQLATFAPDVSSAKDEFDKFLSDTAAISKAYQQIIGPVTPLEAGKRAPVKGPGMDQEALLKARVGLSNENEKILVDNNVELTANAGVLSIHLKDFKGAFDAKYVLGFSVKANGIEIRDADKNGTPRIPAFIPYDGKDPKGQRVDFKARGPIPNSFRTAAPVPTILRKKLTAAYLKQLVEKKNGSFTPAAENELLNNIKAAKDQGSILEGIQEVVRKTQEADEEGAFYAVDYRDGQFVVFTKMNGVTMTTPIEVLRPAKSLTTVKVPAEPVLSPLRPKVPPGPMPLRSEVRDVVMSSRQLFQELLAMTDPSIDVQEALLAASGYVKQMKARIDVAALADDIETRIQLAVDAEDTGSAEYLQQVASGLRTFLAARSELRGLGKEIYQGVSFFSSVMAGFGTVYGIIRFFQATEAFQGQGIAFVGLTMLAGGTVGLLVFQLFHWSANLYKEAQADRRNREAKLFIDPDLMTRERSLSQIQTPQPVMPVVGTVAAIPRRFPTREEILGTRLTDADNIVLKMVLGEVAADVEGYGQSIRGQARELANKLNAQGIQEAELAARLESILKGMPRGFSLDSRMRLPNAQYERLDTILRKLDPNAENRLIQAAPILPIMPPARAEARVNIGDYVSPDTLNKIANDVRQKIGELEASISDWERSQASGVRGLSIDAKESWKASADALRGFLQRVENATASKQGRNSLPFETRTFVDSSDFTLSEDTLTALADDTSAEIKTLTASIKRFDPSRGDSFDAKASWQQRVRELESFREQINRRLTRSEARVAAGVKPGETEMAIMLRKLLENPASREETLVELIRQRLWDWGSEWADRLNKDFDNLLQDPAKKENLLKEVAEILGLNLDFAIMRTLEPARMVNTVKDFGSLWRSRSETRSTVAGRQELAGEVQTAIGEKDMPAVEQAKLGPNLKAVTALEAQGVKGAVIVAAVAGMIFDAGLKAEQMAEVIVALANASVSKAASWVLAVRDAFKASKIEIMDKEGLVVEGVDAGNFDIVPEDLGMLANSKQHKTYAVMADAADVKVAEEKLVAIMRRLAPTLKELNAKDRFHIIVIDRGNPRAARAVLAKFANNILGTMSPTPEGQRNYVLMGDPVQFLGFFKDSERAVMINEPFSRDVSRRIATSILASIVSQRILSASEIDAIREVLNVTKVNGFYSFSQAALNKMLTIALQVQQAIQSAA